MKIDPSSVVGSTDRRLAHLLPGKQVGVLFPVAIVDNTPYEFYRMVPEGIMLLMVPMGIKEFSPDGLQRAMGTMDEYLAVFKDRGVDLILQDGVPVALLMGPECHDKLLNEIEEKTGIPTTSTVTCVVSATRFLGIGKLAVVNKWNDQMNKALSAFFERKGIQVVETRALSLEPSAFLRLRNEESLRLAYNLGREALKNDSNVEGLYIGGGSWLTAPIINLLEKEFDKPVITNTTAIVWHLGHLLNCLNPIQGFGRLLHQM